MSKAKIKENEGRLDKRMELLEFELHQISEMQDNLGTLVMAVGTGMVVTLGLMAIKVFLF